MDFSVHNENDGYLIDEEMSQQLQAEVTKKEITDVLSSIKDYKSPGADGFSSLFFKATWSVVGDDFGRAIQNFFRSNGMLRVVNATYITLVPKVYLSDIFEGLLTHSLL